MAALKRAFGVDVAVVAAAAGEEIYFFSVFLGRRTAWMLGRTPP